MVFGIFPASMWYWCTDQVIVQRVLSARTERDGRLGTIVAALLKVSVPFMMVVPGIVCKALYVARVAAAPPSPSPLPPPPTHLDAPAASAAK